MTFLYGKWKAVEELKKLREKYGENSEVIARDGLKNGEVKHHLGTEQKHPFGHLLNKKFKVPQYPVDPRFVEAPVRTFIITDEQKQINARRRAERIKTSK